MKLRINPEALSRLDPVQRKEAEVQLRQLEDLRRSNPLVFYEPHPKQVAFHSSTDPLKCFLGGNRSGKTTAGMIDDLIQAIDRDAVPAHLQAFKFREPPFFCRIVIPDLTNTLDKVVLQKVRDWCPPDQLKGGSVEQAWQEKMRVLSFKNGSYFQFFSNDQELDKFGGAALHRIHYDEEPREDIRKESLMRLIDFGGDELFTMTPLQGMSWTYTDVYEPWEKGELEGATVITVDMDDNPHLNEETKVRVLSGLSSEEKEARKSGRFVHFAGLIYPQFSSEHVIPELHELPPDVRPIAGIDNGIRHMAGIVLCFLDPDGVLTVFDELPLQGLTVERVAEEFHKRWAAWGVEPRWSIIDPASKRREEQTGKSIRDAYLANGIVTLLGQNEHLAGFNAVKERLERQPHGLRVAANCTELIREFKRYRWKSPSSRSEDDPKEMPIRKDDHLLDALRYVCLSPMVRPKRPRVEESLSVKQQMLRENLRALTNPVLQHPSGPGVFA